MRYLRNRLVLFLGLFCAVPAIWHEANAAEPEPFYIYAPSRSTGFLSVIEARPADSGFELELKQHIDLGLQGSSIVAHPEKPLLYVAAVRGKDGQRVAADGIPGAVVELDPQSQAYVRHTHIALAHAGAYLSLDRRNRFLLSADYFGGNLVIYPLGKDGLPGKPVTVRNEGHPFAHCVLPSPDNRFLYVPYVKEHNALYQYRFDADKGKITPLEPLNAGPPDGTGPRHLAYHPEKPFVYFSNEQHLGVSVYQVEKSGTLKLHQVCDAVGEDRDTDGISSSDIVITPDGRFLFAGIRGHRQDFDRISAYRIGDDGQVTLLGLTPADMIPWGMALSPDGKTLVVSAYQGATITAFGIGENGELSKVASLACDEQIADIVTR